MNRRRVVLLVSAVLLALLGMFIIVAYVASAERRALEGTELVPVLVAGDEIDANTPASDLGGLVTTEEVPVRLRQPDAVRNLDNLVGQVTTSPIRAGEQIVRRQFGEPDEVASGGGSGIKPSHGIVTIALESQRAVGGRLSPGDLVSVIVSLGQAQVPSETDPTQATSAGSTTGVVLSNVPVTAVTGGVSEESGQGQDVVMVSLEVDPTDAELVVFGMEHGQVWLTLDGEDVPRPDPEPQTPEDIYTGGRGG